MDIRVCPDCGILFDILKRWYTLNYDKFECPCCHGLYKDEEYERYLTRKL